MRRGSTSSPTIACDDSRVASGSGSPAALVLLVTGFSLATDHFFSWTTLVALANQAPEALLLATG